MGVSSCKAGHAWLLHDCSVRPSRDPVESRNCFPRAAAAAHLGDPCLQFPHGLKSLCLGWSIWTSTLLGARPAVSASWARSRFVRRHDSRSQTSAKARTTGMIAVRRPSWPNSCARALSVISRSYFPQPGRAEPPSTPLSTRIAALMLARTASVTCRIFAASKALRSRARASFSVRRLASAVLARARRVSTSCSRSATSDSFIFAAVNSASTARTALPPIRSGSKPLAVAATPPPPAGWWTLRVSLAKGRHGGAFVASAPLVRSRKPRSGIEVIS